MALFKMPQERTFTVRVGCHQPNFIPQFPFFYKMAMCDVFVILTYVQFEKNNYQNRCNLSNGDWITKSVNNGVETIRDKKYCDGQSLLEVNMMWINTIKRTLNINTKIFFDYPTKLTKTNRLIDIIKTYGGDTYITSETAKEKYLDEDLMKAEGIKIEYCKPPKHLQKPIFEMLQEYGIDSAIKQLPRKVELCVI